MNKNRCPWCGKVIDRLLDCNVEKRKTPQYLRFAKCHNCNNYYGQHIHSKIYLILILLWIPVTIFSFLLELFPLIIVYALVFIPSFLLIPLSRMNENEDFVEFDNSLEFKAMLTQNQTIKVDQLYFFTDDFDKCEVYSTVSPIFISYFDKNNSIAFGYFLYDHPQNEEFRNSTATIIYDSENNPVGKINFLNY